MIDIGWLAENGPCETFGEGKMIPCIGGQGASKKNMYILVSGKVDVKAVSAKDTPPNPILPGGVFGGREFFTGEKENEYIASVDSVVYVLSEISFSELSRTQPGILFEILRAAYAPPNRLAAPVETVQPKPVEPVAAESIAEAEPNPAPPKADAPVSGPVQSSMPVTISAGNAVFPDGHKTYPGITKPDYLRLVYKKDYVCPFCKKKLTDFRIFGSKLYESAPMRFDLRKFYTGFQTEWYELITCRHCYFSTVHNYYTDAKPILKQKIENELAAARETVHLDFDAERDIDYVFASHYLALICADGYLSLANPLRAKIWGNLSWLYEDVEDKEMERFAAEKAAAAHEEVYSGTRLTPVQEQLTCLSIAGMQYRAGIDRNLRKFLFQVKTTKMGDKAYVIMAEDMMERLRENS